MERQDPKEQAEAIRKFAKKLAGDRKASLAFLIKAGICNAKGELKPVYR